MQSLIQENKKRSLTDYWILILTFLTYAYFYQGGFANQNTRFNLTNAMVFEKTLSIETFHENTVDKIEFQGKHFSEKAPGTSLMALPATYLLSFFISLDQLKKNERTGDILLYLVTALTISLVTAISSIFFRRSLLLLSPECSQATSVFLTFLVYLGTPLFAYATMLFSHALSASLLIFAVYLGLTLRTITSPLNGFLKLCGVHLFLGYAMITEYPVLFPAMGVSLGIYFLLPQETKRTYWASVTMLLVPALIWALYQYQTFGSIFNLGYGNLRNTIFDGEMSKGFFGVRIPSLKTAILLLFGTYRGLFFYAPFLLFAFCGYFRRHPSTLLPFKRCTLLGIFGILAVNAGYGYWQGGLAFGPRHLVPIIPLLGLGLALVPFSWLKTKTFLFLAVFSFGLNLLGTAISPLLGEYDLQPVFNSYLKLLFSNQVSVNPLSYMTPEPEFIGRWLKFDEHPWSSFNLGELMGIRGFFSLLPLFFLWGYSLSTSFKRNLKNT